MCVSFHDVGCITRPEEQKFNSAQPSAAQSPALHIMPLSCGVRIVPSETAAAAGSPRTAATVAAAVSAESPSECSVGAADLFPYDTMHAVGSYQPQGTGTGNVRDAFASPRVVSSEPRADHRMQLPLFHHQQQQQQGGPGQLLESLAEAAEEVERRAGGALGPGSIAGRSRIHPQPQLEQPSGVFTKTLDYKSCDHIMCLTKDMARHLFPQPPHTSAGTCPTILVLCHLPIPYRCSMLIAVSRRELCPLL